MPVATPADIERLEIDLLMLGIFRRYGYDFRDYAPAFLTRRVSKALHEMAAGSVSALQGMILSHEDVMRRFLDIVMVDVTALFRDPSFYSALRSVVFPLFAREPLIRVWHAGCARGLEVYSMAILLHEAGLLDRARLYATDLNQAHLAWAAEGVYPVAAMQTYTRNYHAAGGTAGLSSYYTAGHERVIMKPFLRRGVVWAQHNLVTDASFNEFHIVLCRNVMIYFKQSLQDRCHRLFYQSLAPGGVLGLGSHESMAVTPHEADYTVLDGRAKLFRRTRGPDGNPP